MVFDSGKRRKRELRQALEDRGWTERGGNSEVQEAPSRLLRSITQILEHLPRLGYTPEEVDAGRDAYVRRYRGTTRSMKVLTQLDILGMMEEEIMLNRKRKRTP